MQKKVIAAIYQKVCRVYEDEASGKFLSLPDTTQVFSPEDIKCLGSLNTGNDVEAFERNSNTLFDFSRRMNSPIRGFTTRFEDGEMLWEVYDGILKRAILAKGNVNAIEEKNYQNSLALLFKDGELRNPSPEYEAYRSYRDQYFKAIEEYDSVQYSSSSVIGDEADALQKKLALAKSRLSELQRDWALFGYKEIIESALNVYENGFVANPYPFWEKLKNSFNPDLDLHMCNGKDYYATTYIFPTSFIDEKWNTITILGSELSTLYNSAPKEIKNLCHGGDKLSGISAINLEYRSVRVERPWFNATIFKSKLWRMPAGFDQKISFGTEELLGRFPAYVSALLLLRNGTITYSSGKTETLFNTSSSASDDLNQGISVLAYICKRIPTSPNPDESADWPVGQKATASLQLRNTVGGTIRAYIGEEEVGTGNFNVGESVCIKAIPNDGYYLETWTVNGEVIEHPRYTFEGILSEGGLTVTPVWALGISINPKSIKTDKDTLNSISSGPDHLDMNQSGLLSQVRVIAKNSFNRYTALSSIIIGEHVEVIEDNAFSKCRNLKHVFIPESVRLIGDSWPDSTSLCTFEVALGNKTFVSLDGFLFKRDQLLTIQALTCRCGFKCICFVDTPSTCPQCGNHMDVASSQNEMIPCPDGMVPFMVTKENAEALVRKHYARTIFSTKDFKDQVARTSIQLTPVYAPCWKWSLQAEGKFRIKTLFSGHQYPSIRLSETKVLVPASQIIKDDAFDDHSPTESFRFDKAPAGTLFEFYSKNMYEGWKNVEEQVSQKLREDAKKQVALSVVIETEDQKIDYKYPRKGQLVFHPFWVGSFKYNENSYSFFVDANSGKVTPREKPPMSWKFL